MFDRTHWMALLLLTLVSCRGDGEPEPELDKTTSEAVSMSVLERTREPLLVSDRPWEAFTLNYLTVIKEGPLWRMWYAAYDPDYEYDCDAYLCYAVSQDGVQWEKPELDLVPWKDRLKTNILMDGPAMRANATTVFRDDGAPSGERYKALLQKFLGRDENGRGVWQNYAAGSSDGLKWDLLSQSIYPWNSDTQNVCFRDGDRYRFYVRLWRGVDEAGNPFVSTETRNATTRTIGLSESTEFSGFPKAQEILAPRPDDPADMDFYNSACSRIKEDLYVMFISAFYKREGVMRVHGAWSRDGRYFQRLSSEPLLDLGSGFDSKLLYVAPGAIPGPRPDTYWFYYLGQSTKHDNNVPGKVRHGAGVGRFLVQILDRGA